MIARSASGHHDREAHGRARDDSGDDREGRPSDQPPDRVRDDRHAHDRARDHLHTDDHARDDDDARLAPLELLEPRSATDIRLYDATDLSWITIIVDHVMSCLGQPWRVLRERLEHAPIRGARVAAILGAMRRMMDGRAQRTKIARKVRASVLGHPALDDTVRAERLTRAGDELGIDPSEIESLLWIDLAEERPVTLPSGRPDENRLAAYANVDRIQHALRRAKHVRIHAWGHAHPLIRMAARYGLLSRISTVGPAGDEHTIIDIVGPLSLFHQTQVYGRALGSIVPVLSGLQRFVVEIDADFGYGMAALRVASPALLPAPEERGKPSIASKIASALDRVRNLIVKRDPPPIAGGTDRLFPDLAIEIVGPITLPVRTRKTADEHARQDRDREDREREDRDREDREREDRDREDREREDRDREDRERDSHLVEDDRDLIPDLTALLALQMTAEANRIAPCQIVGGLPARELDRSRCWFVEVIGFATAEYLTAKLARYAAAGVERVVLVVDDTRATDLAVVRHVVAYKSQTIVSDLLAIIEEAP